MRFKTKYCILKSLSLNYLPRLSVFPLQRNTSFVVGHTAFPHCSLVEWLLTLAAVTQNPELGSWQESNCFPHALC